jgi:hypothetical protein
MALGNQNLTGVTREQAMTAPGMAFFAGTGPYGKKCGDCTFKGFFYSGHERVHSKTGNIYTQTHRSNGCKKTYDLRGSNIVGPDFSDKCHACKYFVQRPAQ